MKLLTKTTLMAVAVAFAFTAADVMARGKAAEPTVVTIDGVTEDEAMIIMTNYDGGLNCGEISMMMQNIEKDEARDVVCANKGSGVEIQYDASSTYTCP